MAIIEKKALVGKTIGGILIHETFNTTDVFVGPDGKPIIGTSTTNTVENVYNNETERTSGTYSAGDIGKIYLQKSDNTLWLLTNNDPQEWLLLGGADQIFNYVYHNTVDRTSKVYTNGDIGKIARQTDDNSLWVLTNVDGNGNGTWVQLLTSTLIGQPNGIASLDSTGKIPTSQVPDIDGTKITGNLDGSKITGVLSLSQIPAAALERLIHTPNESTRLSLTSTTVQNGDTVQQDDTGILYIVADIDNANSNLRFVEYAAGTAANAAHATNADYATNAGSATSATSATTATNANYATSAGSATSATSATTATNANYATSAGSATTATNANYATSAGSATSAANATTAETANKIRIGTPISPQNGDIWIEPA